MIGLPYDKMQAQQANIQIVGANCSKPLPLFGNVCLSLMFSVIALCVVGSHCGVYRKRICPPALPALDTIFSNVNSCLENEEFILKCQGMFFLNFLIGKNRLF